MTLHNNIYIRRPTISDSEELNDFFKIVIVDTFSKEGLSHLHEEIKSEIESKKNYLKSDLESNGENRYFLIAIDESKDCIIGSIEYGPSSSLINACTNGELKDFVEIGTVFVLPEYQRQGIGTKLLKNMVLTLKRSGEEKICLDSGYSNAQKVWKKKFGIPQYVLRNYWGNGTDHMIWIVNINDL
ncbi:GNAT family N-acetyltransferase [Heyndrickxia oleronia]|uniref:GNAT family N-acetyltransferase n=1 Tax=Heyndrickxia oleronia TaxID=38875 RepID=UPI001B1D56E5|nr:GNAT family N-acetyltransferase [Heyndrickxia oleronia]GIN37123.1 N-acetyltransferase [Heyndrickxia oleronia]